MNPWYEITELETDPGAPGKAELWKAWWKNPIAIAEGADNAPRVYGLAMSPDSKIVADGMSLTVSAANTFIIDIGLVIVEGVTSTQGQTDVVARTITAAGIVGSIRLKCRHGTGALQSGTATLSLFKNNVLVTSFSTTTNQDRTVDVSITDNDVLQWRHRASSSSASSFSDPSESGSDRYERIGTLIKATDL